MPLLAHELFPAVHTYAVPGGIDDERLVVSVPHYDADVVIGRLGDLANQPTRDAAAPEEDGVPTSAVLLKVGVVHLRRAADIRLLCVCFVCVLCVWLYITSVITSISAEMEKVNRVLPAPNNTCISNNLL